MLRPSFANGFAPRDGQAIWPELWRGCVGAWNPGLGPTGTRLYDWSPYKNHGVLTNMDAGSDWVTSQGRYALDFDGSNDFVLTTLNYRPLAGAFTLSAWVNGRGIAQFGSVITTRPVAFNPTTQKLFGIALGNFISGDSNLRISFGVFDTTSRLRSWITNADQNINRLRHVAAISTGSAAIIYVDGVEQATSLTSVGAWPNIDATGNVSIGAGNDGAGAANAILGDSCIYSRALHPNEIRLLATRPGIAYEMAPRNWSAQMIDAYRRRTQQYQQLVGGGVI